MYVAAQGAEDVAEEAVGRLAPYDISRRGPKLGAGERRELETQLGDRPIWSETQRLMTKKALETQLGVPGAGRISPIVMKHAQLVDQLQAMNPMLSLAEARQMANIMLGHPLPILR